MSCNHETSKPTRRLVSGVMIVSNQCQRCGSGRALKKSLYNLDELPDFDPEIGERYQREIQEKFNKEREQFQVQQLIKTGEWWMKYSAYLLSPEWRLVRLAVLERDPVCQCCFTNQSDQAHHLSYTTYNRFGFTFPAECVGVCNDCHSRIHE